MRYIGDRQSKRLFRTLMLLHLITLVCCMIGGLYALIHNYLCKYGDVVEDGYPTPPPPAPAAHAPLSSC